jgi:hypothetical protein
MSQSFKPTLTKFHDFKSLKAARVMTDHLTPEASEKLFAEWKLALEIIRDSPRKHAKKHQHK